MIECKPEIEEILLKFLEKSISIKISINKNESIKELKIKIENILAIDLKSNYDLYVKKFHIAEVFNMMGLIEFLNNFQTKEIEINKKIILKSSYCNNITPNTELNSEIIPYKNLDDIKKFLIKTERNILILNNSNKELKSKIEELKLLENNLRVIVQPLQSSNNDKFDTLNINSLLNKNSDNLAETGIIYF